MEIERKFLLGALPDAINSITPAEITQGYINPQTPVIRIRRAGSEYFLTVKGQGLIAREEFELAISESEYSHLMTKIDNETEIITKSRYRLPLSDNLTAEIDVYHGSLDGLLTVEVEFNDIEAANAFIPPFWFGKDVTFDKRYANASLSLCGKP